MLILNIEENINVAIIPRRGYYVKIQRCFKECMEMKNLIMVGYSLLFVLIVVLLLFDSPGYSAADIDRFTITRYLENPQKYGGVKLENFGRIVNISQDHFYFDIGSMDLKVFGSGIKRPVLGELVVYIHFNKNGRIEMIDNHTYDYNYVLYGISFFSLIVFIIIFFKEWKFTRRRFEDA
ncbi:MAG: hypothetical protein IH934_04550 [Nanoarchaeota archaeon]|nr:hypothetical protein [Nanoarchaeota archaeon]